MYKDNIIIKGRAILSLCDVTSHKAKEMEKKIVEAILRGVGWEEYRQMIDEFHRLFLKRQILLKNLLPTVGRAVIARILSGDFTYSGEINYCALGTDDTASSNSDTELGTEVYRKLVSTSTYSSNEASISTFYTATETTGTYKEV